MAETVGVVRKKKRRVGRRDPAGDGDRLLAYGTRLLFAAGEAVTPGALAAVARTVPRGEEEAHAPCECGLAARLLILVEGRKADGRFPAPGRVLPRGSADVGTHASRRGGRSPGRRTRGVV